MIWKTITPSELSQWIASQQSRVPPQAYELLAPLSVKEILKPPLVPTLAPYLHVHPQSGAVDVKVPELPGLMKTLLWLSRLR